RLVQTMVPLWSEEIKREGPLRITFEIQPQGEVCRLKVTHDQMREGANDELYGGWPMILSSLKSLLETGKALHFRPPEEAVERWKASELAEVSR
ncbi:MAG TPA: SRPBCC domain-containing protein, partial [Thermoanaerobaculia bacterium]